MSVALAPVVSVVSGAGVLVVASPALSSALAVLAVPFPVAVREILPLSALAVTVPLPEALRPASANLPALLLMEARLILPVLTAVLLEPNKALTAFS